MPAARGAPRFGHNASVLAICGHPDDESFGLGAVLRHLAAHDVRTSVLCFTHGEASSLGEFPAALREIREAELLAAAAELGVSRVELLDYPDGGLSALPLGELAEAASRMVAAVDAELLLVFDEGGVTGHPDHDRATEAALAASSGRPVLAWGVPASVGATLNAEFGTTFVEREEGAFDIVLTVDREGQRRAIACHASQSTHNPVLWRRLELLADAEYLRWLVPPSRLRPRATSTGAS